MVHSDRRAPLLECFVDDNYNNSGDCYIEEIEDTQSWLRMVGKGGLIKCTNDFYAYLRVVEMISKTMITSAFEENTHSETCDLEAMTEAVVAAVQRS